jgi:predicted enzyme related to lactoylglutathione lyase
MSTRDHYPAGVPCWVETLTDDPSAAMRFYGGIFGWEFEGSGPRADSPEPREYFVARLDGRDVAGIAPLPRLTPPPPPAWYTHVAVDHLEQVTERARQAGGEILLEPFDAAPAGRLAVVADPTGAVIGLWEAGARPGAGTVNAPSAWAMSLLTTTDPDAARKFYGEVFGWEAAPFEAGGGMTMWLWRLPGYEGGVPGQPVPRDVVAGMMAGDGSARSGWGADFWITDARAAAAAAPRLGGQVVMAPTEVGGFRRTVLADPQGAVLAVSQLLAAH